jgi:hypothetical protein
MSRAMLLLTPYVCAFSIVLAPASAADPVFTLVVPTEGSNYYEYANIGCGGMCSVQGATCQIQFLDLSGGIFQTAVGTATSAAQWNGTLTCPVDSGFSIPWPLNAPTDPNHTKVKIVPFTGTVSGPAEKTIYIHD